jgi:membrane protease YdiL (CAAX protease family)
MSQPLSNSDSFQPRRNEFEFTKIDLMVFASFFGLTVLFLPVVMISIMRIFRPGLGVGDLTGVEQVLLQGVMDVVLIGFIVFLVKVVHRLSFLDTINWKRNHPYRTSFLIALGAALAVTVLMVSSLFPPSEPPPIERLITSSQTLYVFVLFGVGVAPLVEEIIFRGFLFRVLQDVASAAAAVFGTAMLFTLLHIPQLWGSWAGIALIFGVGYTLSYIRRVSDSLIPSFLVHTAYNGMLFAVYALSTLAQRSIEG